jgi:hypothetical protein
MNDPVDMASNEPTEDSPAAAAPRDRLARRFASILAGYCVLIVVLSALRLYLQQWGLLLTRAEKEILYELLLIHGACALVVSIGAWALLVANQPGKHGLRLLSILTPFFLLASVDRICAYFIPPIYGRTTLFLQDRELGWRHRPGAEGEWAGWVRINRQGYRGPEVAEEKAPDEFRILFLGDSVAFALRTDYEDCFVARIEQALNERADMPVVTTVNMSVSGYSPWQEYICPKRHGLKFRPDLVVHCFCLNDVTEKFNLMRFGGDRIGFEAAMASTGLEWSGIYRLARRARVWLRFGTDVKKAVGQIADREVWDLVDQPDSEFVQNAWSVTEENMADIVHGAATTTSRSPSSAFHMPFNWNIPRKPITRSVPCNISAKTGKSRSSTFSPRCEAITTIEARNIPFSTTATTPRSRVTHLSRSRSWPSLSAKIFCLDPLRQAPTMTDSNSTNFLPRAGRGEPGSVLSDILNADKRCRR